MQTVFHTWAEDMLLLAWLHVRERSRETLLEMADRGFPEGLMTGSCAEATALRIALNELAACSDAVAQNDELAADYAAIYLTHAYRISPCESVWRDEDHLAWQGPTFAVREWYKRYNLAVSDWRALPDDHLSHQMEFVAWLLDKGELKAAASFMDSHLLKFLPDFCTRVAERADTAFYRALNRITLAAILTLRQQLPEIEPQPETVAPTGEFVAPVNFVGRETWLAKS